MLVKQSFITMSDGHWQEANSGSTLSEIISWSASVVALVVAGLAVIATFTEVAPGEPVIPVFGFFCAGLIWQFGRLARALGG